MTTPNSGRSGLLIDDPVAFAAARLDEDEAAAGAGARRVGMPWRAEPQPGTPGGLILDDLGLVGSTGGLYAAEHIARHDPARVLREVEAGRRILARHRPDGYGCEYCDDGGHGESGGDGFCAELADLLYRWADHPDYDKEAWKP
jgi:Family of unknown function (DUF6221)